MKRWSATLLLACGGHAAHEPATRPEPLPPITLREPRAAVPGEKLEALRDLVAPADWVEEAPELDGIWPMAAASNLREAWVLPSTVCRAASWGGAIETAPSDHRFFAELRAHLSGDDRVIEAKLERGRARLALRQERFCVLHDCRPPLSAPWTTLSICVDDADTRGALASLMRRRASLVPLQGVLAVDGVREQSATYERSAARDEIEITLVASPDGQARLQEWLISRGYAVRAQETWQLDSTDPKRTFISYPPDRPDNLFDIRGR